ncbi:xanthine dehydrogenase/oxidase-like isoform X3 [Haliotis rufescens]|uniref:xanthine dehydrogenase/oxidase-like isoform X3 n=1 Tax=Haliotis rufescens TaxID=6454 RepID=UPI00201F0B44|nr:xanthine dehydrogenase/oxidase-like isoform X3 [Haliotis rufescens]
MRTSQPLQGIPMEFYCQTQDGIYESSIAMGHRGEVTDELIFFVNGLRIVEPNPDPHVTLLQYLRNRLRLTGSKLGCGEGGCGACTVMVSRYNSRTDTISHYSVNACLAPICSLHGLAVTTVEGIGSTKTRLHPVQERLAKAHGSQCGFCTPGIVMSMYTLLRNSPQPTQEQIEDNFDGNLCRCTGYRAILQGFESFTKGVCGMGEACCRNRNGSSLNGAHDNPSSDGVSNGAANGVNTMPYDPSQEPIFPPELKTRHSAFQTSLCYKNDKVTWFRPVSLEEVYELKAKFPSAKMVVGNTEVGIEIKFKKMDYPVLIAATHITELMQTRVTDTGLVFGASVTLSTLQAVLEKAVAERPESQTRVFASILEMLRWFAGHQIRNVASIGGNVMTASPISDLNPLFVAAGAELTVGSKANGIRVVKMDKHFFTGYRKTAIASEEVLVSVHLPYTSQNEYFSGFKQAHRKDDDISIVNAGMKVEFLKGTDVVREITLAYGGMAPTIVLATKTMEALVGRSWNDELVDEACRTLESDLPLDPGSPGGMVEYRRTLTTSFFFKFYLSVTKRLIDKGHDVNNKIVSEIVSGCGDITRAVSKGVQVFEDVPDGQSPGDAVGRPLVHVSAQQQTTGEAVYVDDLPKHEDELYLSMVISTKPHARLVTVDSSEALDLPGVVDYIDHRDIPGTKRWGAVVPYEEEIFAANEVICQGQIIGAVVADTQERARVGADKVKIVYEELQPIITIKEAEAAKSFFDKVTSLSRGDLEVGFSQSDHFLEGEIEIGSQEHFYLETQAAAAIPSREEGVMELYTNSQFPSQIQHTVAETLGVRANKVISRVKRIGGGFGGKQSRTISVALPVAVAANKLRRPVRCMLDRDEDMVITGTRHAFIGRYKVGFTSTGRIMAYDVKLFSNSGSTIDLSPEVMTKAVSGVDNAYFIPHINVVGRMCKTNIPSATAFRGFGAPQGMFVTESVIDKMADFLNIPGEVIRSKNLYKEGELTHYNQPVIDAHLPRLWSECVSQSGFTQRRKEVDKFNSESRWKKRGLCVIPTKFGLSYEAPSKFLNQACALVTLYLDGSVLVSHCGVEMGQGLHTKMIQVTSRALGVPASDVFINDTATDKIPYTSPTAASSGSDLNGGAVQNACEILRGRLEPYIKAKPKGNWSDWVSSAYMDRVPLSASGSFFTKGLDYDEKLNKGTFFNYFSCGVACSEVEIDCLTGDHQVLQTDIVMDVGRSLNPSIDIGQIEGAFMQGYGLFCLEQQKISPAGLVLTRGPGTYKIPGFKNIPVTLNVTLLKDSVNKRAVYSSKGIGEPPLFLASSVFFAIKDAIKSARKDAGESREFRLDSPATPEKIRMACRDQFSKQVRRTWCEGENKMYMINSGYQR